MLLTFISLKLIFFWNDILNVSDEKKTEQNFIYVCYSTEKISVFV